MKLRYWVYRDETGDTGDTGGGGGTSGAPAAGEGTQGTDAGGEGATSATAPKSMLEALDAGLGYKTGEDGGGTGAAKPQQSAEEKAAADDKAAEEAAIKERDEKAAKGDPGAIKAKQDAEAAAKAEAAKPKDLKALELSEADKKVMKGKTAERYNEVLGIAKAERTRAETAEGQVKALAVSRDAILGVLKETNTTQEDLGNLLEFNRLIKSGQPADMETALKIVTNQRLALLKALGREGDGHDPLTEFPDLAQEVEDQKITRERALELAAVRKRDAITKANAEAQQRGKQSAQQKHDAEVKAQQDGLASIESWSAQVAKTDIDFKAKEAILLPKITEIVKNNPPDSWLKTIKLAYSMIVVQKASSALPKTGDQPLRASGAKAGNAAPTSMQEAIDQGLGYAKG